MIETIEVSFSGCGKCWLQLMKEMAAVSKEIQNFRVDLSKTRHDSRVLHSSTCEFINAESQEIYGLPITAKRPKTTTKELRSREEVDSGSGLFGV